MNFWQTFYRTTDKNVTSSIKNKKLFKLQIMLAYEAYIDAINEKDVKKDQLFSYVQNLCEKYPDEKICDQQCFKHITDRIFYT
jgi:hypothetical protein